MALFTKKTDEYIQTNSTGFGTNSNYTGGRFYNKDGTVNVKKRGMPWYEVTSIYHSLLAIRGWKFIAIIILFFITINLFFASLYLLIGVDHLGGLTAGSNSEKFGEAFFFSAQTFTTVGYGRINPVGFATSAVAAIEALIGLLTFALATGLLYGRFSRPKAYLKYSKNALIAPYKDGTALMFRCVPYKNNQLSEVECTLTCAMQWMEEGKMMNKFYFLPLELNKINALSLSWTVVHPIKETSPLYEMTLEDFKKTDTEFIVFIKAFDESSSSSVVSRTSYTYDEIIYGAKFRIMYHENETNTTTILDLDKLDEYDVVELPKTSSNETEGRNVYAQ